MHQVRHDFGIIVSALVKVVILRLLYINFEYLNKWTHYAILRFNANTNIFLNFGHSDVQLTYFENETEKIGWRHQKKSGHNAFEKWQKMIADWDST